MIKVLFDLKIIKDKKYWETNCVLGGEISSKFIKIILERCVENGLIK